LFGNNLRNVLFVNFSGFEILKKGFNTLNDECNEEQITLYSIADISDLIILVGIYVINSQKSFNKRKMFIPIKHINHED
jgi:hypothetical protein